MSSTLKPVISQGSKTSPVPPQINKPIHPQAIPTTYAQSISHLPQNMISVPPHNSITHHVNTNTNHFSLNVPNAPQHYVPPGVMGHPVNSSFGAPQKAPTYESNYLNSQGGTFDKNINSTGENVPDNLSQSNGTSESVKPSYSPAKERPEKVETVESHEKVESVNVSAPSTEEKIEDVVLKNDESSNSGMDSNDSEPPEDTTVSAVTPEAPGSTPSAPEPKPEVPECETPKKEEVVEKEPPKSSPSKENSKSSTIKVATTVRTPVRRPKPKQDTPEIVKTPKMEKSPSQKSPGTSTKAKRNRVRTQHYQSPLPEVEMISKMTITSKTNEDRLILFFKNEFLAVRNAEGGFYVCQVVQNVYKSSSKIRIRWLSQDKNDKTGELYAPDFYDNTDFDCILTNLNLQRLEKGKFRLPPKEKERTDNILKRALAVEMGESKVPSPTEEHPDGIDLSLYKEERQLKKRRPTKRKATSPLRASKSSSPEKKSPEVSKVKKASEGKKPIKKQAPKKAIPEGNKKVAGRLERVKRRVEEAPSTSKAVDSKKAKVLAKMVKKKVAATVPATKLPKTVVKSSKSGSGKGPKQPPAKVQSPPVQQVRKSKRGRK